MDKFYNVLMTSLEMIKDRGFKVLDEDLQIDYEIFKYRYNLFNTSDAHDHIFDFFYETATNKILITYIKNYSELKNTVDFLKDEYEIGKDDTLVLVLTDFQSQFNDLEKIKNKLTEFYLKKGGCRVQVFLLQELAFNLTKHRLVPKHRLMNPVEVDKLRNQYTLTSLKQLPIILESDPVSKYFNFKPGNVCEITRMNVLTGISKAYRLVI